MSKKIKVVIPHQEYLKLQKGQNVHFRYAFTSEEWNLVNKSLNSPYDYFMVRSDHSNKDLKCMAYYTDIIEFESDWKQSGKSFMKVEVKLKVVGD